MPFGGFLDSLKRGLAKTRKALASPLKELFGRARRMDADFLEELEEILISADVGVAATMAIIDDLSAASKERKVSAPEDLYEILKEDIARRLRTGQGAVALADTPPTVILVAGVNGTGKTTSIAKLAWYYSRQGKKVLLAAGDTFRAAATEQLSVWAKRIGADIVGHQMGADPAAVAYDACEAAVARGADVLIVDTAGRLHTNRNLMRELSKISSVAAKKIPGAPHEVILVLDATNGQNAIVQAEQFKQAIDVTGIFLAKLDGTARGGIVIAICDKLGIPVKFVGVGEACEDIEPFDAERFTDALFE
ncbi:MAG: signal recognition particle-docking protein FtsY [Planctomycetes bacterium]|nr:signal recognition particle-docking protein FtsY [Planctomycetota bacterium]